MGKGLAAGVHLKNHVSGIAYGMGQTAVERVVSPDIISITACPQNHFYVLFACTYHIILQPWWHFYDSRTAEELHNVLGCLQQHVVLEYTHDHSRKVISKSMTSANGGNYAGQYSSDGWVDNLEPTLLLIILCFLIFGQNLKTKNIHELSTRQNVT